MASYIKKIDIFGNSPLFFFNQESRHQTKVGGVLTCSILVFIIVAAYQYSKDFFKRENPITNIVTEYIGSPERVDIDKTQQSFMIGLQSPKIESWQFIDESVYTMQILHQEKINRLNETSGEYYYESLKRTIPFKVCEKSDFQVKGTQDYFHALSHIPLMYCLDFDNIPQNETLYIQGDAGQKDTFSSFRFQFKQCINSTEPNSVVCKPQNEIEEILLDARWALYTTDQILDPSNFDKPFSTVGRQLFGYASKFGKKFVDLNFENQYVQSNIGLAWDQFDIKKGLVFASQITETGYTLNPEDTFLDVRIRFQKTKQTRVYRSYVNVATILAQVGGIMKLAFTTFLILYTIIGYNHQEYYIKLAKQVFRFSNKIQTADKQNQSQASMEDLEKNSPLKHFRKQSDNIKKTTLPDSDIGSFGNSKRASKSIKNYFDKINNKFRDIKINGWKATLGKSCLNDEEKEELQMLEYGINQLKSQLDLIQILHKFQEIDKLKNLLLNKEQKELFEYIEKPVIYPKDALEQSENKFIYYNKTNDQKQYFDDRNELEKLQGAYQAYQKIVNQHSLSPIDNKVLKSMDDRMVKYFEKLNKQTTVQNQHQNKQNTHHQASQYQQYQSNENNTNILSLIECQTQRTDRKFLKGAEVVEGEQQNQVESCSLSEDKQSQGKQENYEYWVKQNQIQEEEMESNIQEQQQQQNIQSDNQKLSVRSQQLSTKQLENNQKIQNYFQSFREKQMQDNKQQQAMNKSN